MAEFKIGDRVRVVDNKNWASLAIGTLATVTKSGDVKYISVKWDTHPGSGIGIHTRRFELIEPELTDEELAAKYRALRQDCHKTWQELRARGYSISGKTEAGINIYKYVEEEVPVIKIEKVKKEI